ncbi:MAG: porin family protein [Bacteroidales bacterium]|jgi:hypothetical protein
MKKVVVFIIALTLFMGFNVNSNAQGFIIKGGLSYANMGTQFENYDVKSYTGYHFGVGVQTGSLLGFSLQPELLYNVSGSKIGENIDWVQGYLQLPVNIQWGIDLMICKPYIQVSPFVGYCLSNTLSGTGISTDTNLLDYISDNSDRFDYGVGIGAGLELWKLQVSAKYIWNFGNVTDWNEFENNLGNITTDNAGAVEVSIAIKF